MEVPTMTVTSPVSAAAVHHATEGQSPVQRRVSLRKTSDHVPFASAKRDKAKSSRSPSRGLLGLDDTVRYSPPVSSSDDEVSLGDESASSSSAYKAGDDAYGLTKKHKEKDGKKKKKKMKRLAQSVDSLGGTPKTLKKSGKKHATGKSEEADHKGKKDHISKARSPKKHQSGSSDEESDADKHDRKTKFKRNPVSSKKLKKHKKSTRSHRRHKETETNTSDDDSSSGAGSSDDSGSDADDHVTSRKVRKAHREKSSRSRRGDHSSNEASEEERREKRRSNRSSRSSSRGNSQERGKSDAIRRRSPRSPDPSPEASSPSGIVSPKEEEIGRMHKELEALKNLTKILEEKLDILEHTEEDAGHHSTSASLSSSTKQHSTRTRDKNDKSEPRKKIRLRGTSTPAFSDTKVREHSEEKEHISRSTADLSKFRREQLRKKEVARKESDTQSSSDADDDRADDDNSDRKLRKSISLTELRSRKGQSDDGEVGQIKKDHDIERKVNQKRAKRERARGKREAERQEDFTDSKGRGRTVAATNIAPFGNTPATKALECFSCLMKTDIATDGDRKLWKRRVLGLGPNGLHLIKPYTEKTERLWPWSTIQQWIINDEQNLIKFMVEEELLSDDSDESSSEDEHDPHFVHKDHHGNGHAHGHAHGHVHSHGQHHEHEKMDCRIAVYTFRVEDVNRVNDSLWKVVKRVQKKRREKMGWDKSSTTSSARASDDESTSSEEEHHHFKESMQSFFKALTHSLGHHKSDHKSDHHKADAEYKERK